MRRGSKVSLNRWTHRRTDMTEIFTYLRTRVLIKAKIKGKFFSYQIFASHKFAEIRTLQFRGHTHTHTSYRAQTDRIINGSKKF